MSTTKQQAEEVECRAMEVRDFLEMIAKKPVGKGGLDPADLERRKMRLETLKEAAHTLYRVADKDDARRAAEEGRADE